MNNVTHEERGVDDIFIDKHQDEDYLDVDNGGEIDFFDDILNDGVPNVKFNFNARKLH